MPRDINLLLEEEDINHLNNILQDDQNNFTFFHQLGLLSAYLQVAPLGSDDAHTYRWIPQIAHQFAFECSNGCENIFTKQGQNKKVNNSNVYVMASKLTASNYSRLKNISAFLNGNEFYDLQAGHLKKSKTVYWVANETVRSYLEDDFNFFDGLEHNIEESILVKVKKEPQESFQVIG